MTSQQDLPSMVQCPSCNKIFKRCDINAHVNRCLDKGSGSSDILIVDDVDENNTSEKGRKRKSSSPNSCENSNRGWGFLMRGNDHVNQAKKVKVKQGPRSCETESVIIDDDKSVCTTVSKQNGRNDIVSETQREAEVTCVDMDSESSGNQNSSIDLFTLKRPLAEEMRPEDLDSYIGQQTAVGQNTMLWSLLQKDTIPSMLLWGPPGCGKTTLARIVANKCKQRMKFVQLSATSSGVADVKEMIKNAKNNYRTFKKRTILFLDEIHCFNKTQQHSLLPHVEDGTITLIGATTENPSFQINTALLSRCKVIVLEKLNSSSIQRILKRAVEKLGYDVCEDAATIEQTNSNRTVYIEVKALETISLLCDGDARAALNGLQMIVQTVLSKCNQSKEMSQKGIQLVTVEAVKKGFQRTHVAYDKTGDEHYNCASAIQKSMRGSNASAALYWLARMLEGGESPLYIARRLISFASEDIGLADNQALSLAVSTYQACHFLGMPECEKNLAQCVVYLARAPKSVEVYHAYSKAKESVKHHQGPLPGVPLHLRNASTKLMKDLGYGKGYKYNPTSSAPVDQEYFPEGLVGTNFFQ